MASSMVAVAMDCEMVGLGPSRESGLARCSLVDFDGLVIYDKFIRPEGEITDYRTRVSGIRPQHMEKAIPFAVARREVSEGPGASQAKGGCGQPPLDIYTLFPGAFPKCQIRDLCHPWVGSCRAWRNLWVSPSHPHQTAAARLPAGSSLQGFWSPRLVYNGVPPDVP